MSGQDPASRAVVTVTVGTGHYPFPRLLGWLDTWFDANPEAEGFVQHGCSEAPRRAAGAAAVPRARLLERMRGSAAVVTHGGTGSIRDARSVGVLPIVVPRSGRLGEAVDDHQIAFCERLAADGWIHLATTESDTHRHLDRALRHDGEYRLTAGAVRSVPPAAGHLTRICAELAAESPRLLYPGRITQAIRMLRGRYPGTYERGARS